MVVGIGIDGGVVSRRLIRVIHALLIDIRRITFALRQTYLRASVTCVSTLVAEDIVRSLNVGALIFV